MKTIAIKLNNVIVAENNLNKSVFVTLMIILATLSLLYFYLFGRTIYNVIDRENLELDIRNLSSEVDILGIKYIELSKTIDYNMALSLGFKESEDTHFASRKQAIGSLVEKTNEL